MLERNGDLPQLVAGDFNIDLLPDELVLRKKIENMMAAHCLGLISLRKATRENETSSSCIDATFGKVPLLKSTNKKTTFFDHYSLHLNLDLKYEAMECIYRFPCLKKLGNRDDSENVSLYLAHTLGTTEKTGQSGEAYITKVAEVIIKRVTDDIFHCQDLKKFSSQKTWITNRIKRHIKIRGKFFQLWLKSKSETTYLNYKNIRNEINMEIKLAKRRDVQNKNFVIIKIRGSFKLF